MKKLIVLAIFLLCGCEQLADYFEDEYTGADPSPCRSVAAYTAAYASGLGMNYEIVYGTMIIDDGSGVAHVQTRAEISPGAWRWLSMETVGNIIYEEYLWFTFYEERIFTAEELFYMIKTVWRYEAWENQDRNQFQQQ